MGYTYDGAIMKGILFILLLSLLSNVMTHQKLLHYKKDKHLESAGQVDDILIQLQYSTYQHLKCTKELSECAEYIQRGCE